MIKIALLKKSLFREKIITSTKKTIGYLLKNIISSWDIVARVVANIVLTVITKMKNEIYKTIFDHLTANINRIHKKISLHKPNAKYFSIFFGPTPNRHKQIKVYSQ